MKVAIIVDAAGAPNTLAVTSYAGTLAEGFAEAGADVRIIGLATSTSQWVPEMLGVADTSAPWLHVTPPGVSALAEGLRAHVFEGISCAEGRVCESRDWHLELLLLRDLESFVRGASDGVVIVYSRSIGVLVPAVRASARLGLKLLVLANEALTDEQIDPAVRDDYIRWVVDCADGVWAVSKHLSMFWRDRGVSPERLFVSASAIRRSHLQDHGGSPRKSHAVFVGNLVHRDVDYLVEIAERVADRIPDFRLTIYGDSSPERREELAGLLEQRDLADVVRVLSPVPPLDIPRVLAHADVLVLPRASGEYSTAGFPRKLSEYLASGRPTVVTSVGDISLHISNGRDALLVEPDDCVAFSEAVIRVLTDQELADRLGREGRHLAERRFLAKNVAESCLSFIEGLPVGPRLASNPPFAPRRWAALLRALTPIFKRWVVRRLRRLHLKPPGP